MAVIGALQNHCFSDISYLGISCYPQMISGLDGHIISVANDGITLTHIGTGLKFPLEHQTWAWVGIGVALATIAPILCLYALFFFDPASRFAKT
jgi:hypothetical protein